MEDKNRQLMREKLRDMLRDMGFKVPDELQPREIIVRDENGNIIQRKWVGGQPEDKNNVGRKDNK